jgi:hypothetical protein
MNTDGLGDIIDLNFIFECKAIDKNPLGGFSKEACEYYWAKYRMLKLAFGDHNVKYKYA